MMRHKQLLQVTYFSVFNDTNFFTIRLIVKIINLLCLFFLMEYVSFPASIYCTKFMTEKVISNETFYLLAHLMLISSQNQRFLEKQECSQKYLSLEQLSTMQRKRPELHNLGLTNCLRIRSTNWSHFKQSYEVNFILILISKPLIDTNSHFTYFSRFHYFFYGIFTCLKNLLQNSYLCR